VARKRQDVVAAFGERRQRELDRVEPVEQVLAELAAADHARQVGVGRADDAHLDLAFAVAAQPLEAPGLEHAQQLHLARRRQRCRSRRGTACRRRPPRTCLRARVAPV
jgi:hypothetical protein